MSFLWNRRPSQDVVFVRERRTTCPAEVGWSPGRSASRVQEVCGSANGSETNGSEKGVRGSLRGSRPRNLTSVETGLRVRPGRPPRRSKERSQEPPPRSRVGERGSRKDGTVTQRSAGVGRPAASSQEKTGLRVHGRPSVGDAFRLIWSTDAAATPAVNHRSYTTQRTGRSWPLALPEIENEQQPTIRKTAPHGSTSQTRACSIRQSPPYHSGAEQKEDPRYGARL